MAQVSTTADGTAGRATIRDIARIAGVSIATVSRVLNDRPDVAPETREAVLAVVRQQGFTTNRSARGLSGGRTGLVGVTIPIVHAAYFSAILSGAGEALYEQDMRIVLCPTLHEHEREVTLLDRLMHGTTDGALLMLPAESSAELKALHRTRLPVRRRRPDGAAGRGHRRPSRRRTRPARRRPPSTCSRSATAASARSSARPPGSRAGSGSTASTPRSPAPGIAPDRSLEIPSDFEIDGGYAAAAEAARPARPSDGDLRLQRQHRHRRDPRGPGARHPHPRGHLARRLRRCGGGGARHADADHGPAAAAGDGPDGGQPADRLLEGQARGAARRARDAARRARVDGARAGQPKHSSLSLPSMRRRSDAGGAGDRPQEERHMDQTSHSGLPSASHCRARPPREAIDALLREDPPAARAIEVGIPMRDGVELAADVHLPPGVQLPAPAIVIGTPYDKSGPFDARPLSRRGLRARDLRLARARQVRGRMARAHADGRPGRARRRGVGRRAGVVQRRRRRHRPQLQRLGRVGDHGGAPTAPARRVSTSAAGRWQQELPYTYGCYWLYWAYWFGLVRRRILGPIPRTSRGCCRHCPSAPSATCSTAPARAGRSSSTTTRWTSCGRAAAGTAPTTSTSRRCT